jgi:hyaluronan synthase
MVSLHRLDQTISLRSKQPFSSPKRGPESPDYAHQRDIVDWVVCWGTIAAILTLFYFSITGRVFQPLIGAIVRANFLTAVIRPSMLWSATGTLFLVLRTVLWLIYRPSRPATFEEAPSPTVIIPAYNEGPTVKKSIYSVLEADYPRARPEVFVIDDGSTDDTWHYSRSLP